MDKPKTTTKWSACGPKTKKSPIAILLLDFQNEFAKPGGKLNSKVSEVMEGTGMLEKVPPIVRAARESNVLVIHSPVIMKPEEHFAETDFDPRNYSKQHGLFTEGTWNCEIIDEVAPDLARPNDEIILTGRTDFCAFEGTRLQEILERRKVKKLFIAGFLSNVCIEETARAAVERLPRLQVTVLTDGCAAMSRKEHALVTRQSLPLYCETMKCSECLFEIEYPDVTPCCFAPFVGVKR